MRELLEREGVIGEEGIIGKGGDYWKGRGLLEREGI